MTTTRTIADIAADLLAARINGGGGTVSTVAGQRLPTTGYVVGINGLGSIIEPSDPEAIAKWVASTLASTLEAGRYVGIWEDKGTNLVYLDVVKVLPERVPAESLARKSGEIAIWDLKGKSEIRV